LAPRRPENRILAIASKDVRLVSVPKAAMIGQAQRRSTAIPARAFLRKSQKNANGIVK